MTAKNKRYYSRLRGEEKCFFRDSIVCMQSYFDFPTAESPRRMILMTSSLPAMTILIPELKYQHVTPATTGWPTLCPYAGLGETLLAKAQAFRSFTRSKERTTFFMQKMRMKRTGCQSKTLFPALVRDAWRKDCLAQKSFKKLRVRNRNWHFSAFSKSWSLYLLPWHWKKRGTLWPWAIIQALSNFESRWI